VEQEEAKFLEFLKTDVKGEGLEASKAIPVDKDKRPIPNKMVDVEGTFSLKLTSNFAASGASDTSISEGGDEVGDLPIITKASKPESSLPMPPTSSRPGSVQPE